MLDRRAVALTLCTTIACVGEITDREGRSGQEGQVTILQGAPLAAELRDSPVHEASEPFWRVGAMWEGDRPGGFEVSVSVDGVRWSDWSPLVVQNIELEGDRGAFAGQYEVADEPATFYRLRGSGGVVEFVRLELLTTTLADAVEGGDEGDDDGVAYSTMVGAAEVHTRAEWGARNHRCSTGIGNVTRMAIHHTETPTSDSVSPQARLRSIQSYHMDVLGWCDIGYHYLMSRDGQLWQGRPEHLLGAHTGGANTGNIGLSVIGSHDATPITSTQRDALASLIRSVALAHHVDITRGNIKGHRQYKSTTCPGDALYGQLDALVALAASGGDEGGGGGGGDGCFSGPLDSDGPWSCGGLTGTTTNAADLYYTTSFGCWVDDYGASHSDSGDNCLPACSLASIGCAGMTGPACERSINWYSADSDRFGCGTLLEVTNPDNGRSAVVRVIDRGPNCTIENKVDHWVLDLSYPASNYLFGGPTSATEREDVRVALVPTGTPLGPTSGDVCEGDPEEIDGGEATVTVTGVLYVGADTSERIAGASVTLADRTTTTSATGLWSFAEVAEGGFTVTASAAGYQSRSITATTYAAETWASFGLSPAGAPTGTAVLQGVVYHTTDSQNRIAGATVSLSTGQSTVADSNGFYHLTGLPAGDVTITASAPGWTPASVDRTLVDGATTWGSVRLTE